MYINSNYGFGEWLQTGYATSWHGIAFDSSASYAVTVVDGGYIYTTTCSEYDASSSVPSTSPTVTPTASTCSSWNTWTKADSRILLYNDITTDSTGKYAAATVTRGYIYTSDDYGASWIETATPQEWTSISMSASGQYVVACYSLGKIYVSSDYGLGWEEVGTENKWISIANSASTGQYIYVVSTDGAIFLNDDYGISNWQPTGTTLGTNSWTSVACSASGEFVYAAASDFGFIYTNDDYGREASWLPTPYSENWLDIVTDYTGKYVAATTSASYIWVSSNYGLLWEQTSIFENWAKNGIAMDSTGQIIAAVVDGEGGDGGFIYFNVNYGIGDWIITESTSENWSGISLDATGSVALACVDGGYIYTTTCSSTNPDIPTSVPTTVVVSTTLPTSTPSTSTPTTASSTPTTVVESSSIPTSYTPTSLAPVSSSSASPTFRPSGQPTSGPTAPIPTTNPSIVPTLRISSFPTQTLSPTSIDVTDSSSSSSSNDVLGLKPGAFAGLIIALVIVCVGAGVVAYYAYNRAVVNDPDLKQKMILD